MNPCERRAGIIAAAIAVSTMGGVAIAQPAANWPSKPVAIVTGGGRPADRDRGFFVQPTLIAGLGNEARVAQEEILGPVLVILPHDGDDDAVRIANDSVYGLSGSVWSGDRDRAVAVANRIRTGTVGVNGGIWFSPDVPFGGYKQSGMGREMGVLGFEEYLETKSIAEPA